MSDTIENAPPVSTEPATSGDGGQVEPAGAQPNYGDYEFVRFPDGTLQAVPKSAIVASQNASTLPVVEDTPAQYFVWLSNGDVETVDAADLPGHAGAQAPNGYFEKDGKVYDVVHVYPVPVAR